MILDDDTDAGMGKIVTVKWIRVSDDMIPTISK